MNQQEKIKQINFHVENIKEIDAVLPVLNKFAEAIVENPDHIVWIDLQLQEKTKPGANKDGNSLAQTMWSRFMGGMDFHEEPRKEKFPRINLPIMDRYALELVGVMIQGAQLERKRSIESLRKMGLDV